MIRVGAHEYKVERQPNLYDIHALFGAVNHDHALILLDASKSVQEQVNTFVHECIHTVAKRYGVKLEEEPTSILAEGLTQIMFQLETPDWWYWEIMKVVDEGEDYCGH